MEKVKLVALISTCTISGIIIGRITKRAEKPKKLLTSGNIRIDRSIKDADPNLFLELTVPLSELEVNRTVMFNVISKDYISH